jgi:hypothetical protein
MCLGFDERRLAEADGVHRFYLRFSPREEELYAAY